MATTELNLRRISSNEVGIVADWLEDCGDDFLAEYARKLAGVARGCYILSHIRPVLQRRDIRVHVERGLEFNYRDYQDAYCTLGREEQSLVAEAVIDFIGGDGRKLSLILALCSRRVERAWTSNGEWNINLEDAPIPEGEPVWLIDGKTFSESR